METLKNFWKNTSKWKIASVVIIAIFALNACSPFKKEKTEKDKTIPSEYVQVPNTNFKSKEQVKTEFEQAGLKVKFVVGNFDSTAEKETEKLIVGTTKSIDKQPNIKYFSPLEYEYTDNGNYGKFSKKGSELVVVYSDHTYNPKSLQAEKSTEKPEPSSSEEQKKDDISSGKDTKTNEDKWYTNDSKYATIEPLKKTIDMQMEELGANDPVYAIIVNDLQTYLSNVAEYDVKEISNELTYDRDGLAIVLTMDGEKLPSEITDELVESLQNTSGKYYTFL